MQLISEKLLKRENEVFAIFKVIPEARFLSKLKGLTLNELPAEDKPIYFMYRDFCYFQHKELFKKNNIRHDITVIPSNNFNGEYVKTVGHYHPLRNEKETFPEYYEVLNGKALFLLQKADKNYNIEEVVIIKAKKGEKVYIPPNYGHITINWGTETLIISNLVQAEFKSIYKPIAEKGGPAYYCLGFDNSIVLFPNKKYKKNVVPQIIDFSEWIKPVETKGTLYESFVLYPQMFSFLK